MKIPYSAIKKILPELKASPREVGEVLTRIGFLMDGLEETGGLRNRDTVISLEVRQNRADCLSVVGICRELAAYYGLKLVLPAGFIDQPVEKTGTSLNIKIRSKEVRRVVAARIDGVTNTASPEWLKNFLELSGMNSVNLLVDISNYVMLVTGYPPHFFDADRLIGGLVWDVNRGHKEVQTFDGTQVNLTSGELVINDDSATQALAGLVGMASSGVVNETKNLLVEIANYDPSIIRENSRKLRIFTEASSRLDKSMSPSGIPAAMNFLLALIKQHVGGQVTASFDYYNEPVAPKNISFDLNLPSKLSGIAIDPAIAVEKLTLLGCLVSGEEQIKTVTPPLERTDLNLPEDLAEEVIRLVGYDKIPAGVAPSLQFTSDITPKIIRLSKVVRELLVAQGYDEILSCPLVKVEENISVKTTNEPIVTQNPINEGYPELRLSLVGGLINQRNEFWKRGVGFVTLFEIGKVFGAFRGQYHEHESLAILVNWRKGMASEIEQAGLPKNLPEFRLSVEKMLRGLGFGNISYRVNINSLPLALAGSNYQILNNQEVIGTIFKLREHEAGATYLAEIDLDKAVEQINRIPAAVEIEDKLVTLDANVILKDDAHLEEYLTKLGSRIPKENLWSVNAIDNFKAPQGNRYTLRVTYVGLGDQAAKTLHARIFS